jgi:hypothetical protein
MQGPGGSGLSQGQQAGIGVGACVGGLLLLVGGPKLLLRWQQRKGKGKDGIAKKKVSVRCHQCPDWPCARGIECGLPELPPASAA